MLGIVAALPGEARALGVGRRAAAGREPLQLARTAESASWLSISGIGPDAARTAARELLAHDTRALLSFGCAAGLHTRLMPGALMVPTRLVDPHGGVLTTNRSWHAGLCAALAGSIKVHTSALGHTRAVLQSAGDKQALFEASGAVAADMESMAVAEVALSAGLPFIAVRAVADTANMTVPPAARAAVDADGRIRPLASLRALAASPAEIGSTIALGRAFSRACAVLSQVAVRTGGRFALDRSDAHG